VPVVLPEERRPCHGLPAARVAPLDEVLLDAPDPLRTPHASPGRRHVRPATTEPDADDHPEA
jgi:hypothetical protein